MLYIILPTILNIVVAAQENPKPQNDQLQHNEQAKPPIPYLGTQPLELQQQTDNQYPINLKQFNAEQQFSPELYGLTYLEPQYQVGGALPRAQPQIVLYGPGGQGQPILINPGNPPGNFLIPQDQGPNIIVRNNPPSPQGPVFPVAGYPKPAHIPPIEKDAEEIPTNPAKIPPLQSDAKPVTKPRAKPEKLETFNEPNQPGENGNNNQGQFPQKSPETVGLQPGQRFFILNGNNVYSFPFEAQPQVAAGLPGLRYTNVQPFPQNPPKFLQNFGQESPQYLENVQQNIAAEQIPKILQRNSFIQSQQSESQTDQVGQQPQQPNQIENDGAIKTIQQYFRQVNQPAFPLYPAEYLLRQQGLIANPTLNQNDYGFPDNQETSSKDEVVQPHQVGQFRFTPSAVPGLYPFRDDFENDAIVVDAIEAGSNSDGRENNLKVEENENTKSNEKPSAAKESEASMAQAAPQATAIAGSGGVAGSAPRGTAIVGKGGLAVSSPRATAAAGTKDEDKNKKTTHKN